MRARETVCYLPDLDVPAADGCRFGLEYIALLRSFTPLRSKLSLDSLSGAQINTLKVKGMSTRARWVLHASPAGLGRTVL